MNQYTGLYAENINWHEMQSKTTTKVVGGCFV